MSKFLGRSPIALRIKAGHLGLCGRRPTTISVNHFAKMIGVTHTTIRNWVDKGYIKAVRMPLLESNGMSSSDKASPRFFFFKPEDIKRFLRVYFLRYDTSKINKVLYSSVPWEVRKLWKPIEFFVDENDLSRQWFMDLVFSTV